MHHSLPRAETRHITPLALTGLFAAALLAGVGWPPFLLAVGVVAAATLLDHKAFVASAKSLWITWLALALTLFILIQTPIAVHRYPVLTSNDYPAWTDLLAIAGVIPVILGWWISRYPRLIPGLIATTGAGIALGVLTGIQWQHLVNRGMGARRDWGYYPEEVGLFAGMMLLGAVVMIFSRAGQRRLTRGRRLVSGIGWLAVAAIAGIVLYGTQTRALWIGSAVLIILYVLWHLSSSIRRRTGARSTVVAALVVVTTLASLTQLDDAERLERRLDGGSDTIAALIALDREAVLQANPSLGERLNMWVEALRAFPRHPVTGWGVGAKVATDELAELHVGWRQPHYHNLYLEFLLGLGLMGLALFLGLCALLITPLTHRAPVPRPIQHILAMATALTAFAFLFELQIGNPAGRAVTVWLMALLAGLAFLHHERVREARG